MTPPIFRAVFGKVARASETATGWIHVAYVGAGVLTDPAERSLASLRWASETGDGRGPGYRSNVISLT